MMRILIALLGSVLFGATGLIAATTDESVNTLLREKKDAEALAVAQKAADAADPEGFQSLAWFYDTGTQVSKSPSKSAELYRKCAVAGLKHCQWMLGVKLDTGDGVDENPKEAFVWIKRSADQGYKRALASMGVMHAMGRGTPVDYGRSMASYRAAAKAGEPHGFYGVGVLYALGQGVPKDEETALAWFIVAHFQGDGSAMKIIEQLLPTMDEAAVQRATDKANAIQREFGLIKAEGAASKK